MAGEYFKTGNGSVWAQEGAGTAPGPLPCFGAGDIAAPEGDLTLIYCRSDDRPNEFNVVDSFRGAPGPRTTTLTTNLAKTQNYLERIKCELNLFINLVECGRMDLFTNRARGVILHRAIISSRGYGPLAAISPDAQAVATRTFDVSAQNLFDIFEVSANRISTAFAEALNAIALYGYADCDNPCIDGCEEMVVAGDSTAGSPSDIALAGLSEDNGATWTAFAADPFAAAENIAALGTLQLGQSTKRIVAARGTTDAGNPAEIAYSDDDGATWTTVNVGTVNGQYVVGPHGLFVLNYYNIWLVTDDGYIYKSEDGGATWTAQESGVITSSAYNAVSFGGSSNGYAVGDGDVIARTTDGGATWSAMTATGSGDDLTDVAVVDKNHVLVGTDGGEVYYSKNGTTTWTSRTFSGAGAGTVTAIEAYNELIMFMTHNTAANVGRIFRTIDGGVNWELVSMPASTANLNSIVVCDANTAFAVGELSGGTATILKVSP